MGGSEGESIVLGDPVPWFSARTVTGNRIDLHVQAGRWIVLAFLGHPGDARNEAELPAIQALSTLAAEDRLVVYGIAPETAHLETFTALTGPAFALIEDGDGSLARRFGAHDSPRTIVLDPMLRAIANIPWSEAAGHAVTLRSCIDALPPLDEQAGVPLFAPVLIVPRVFDFALCDLLVNLYDEIGGTDSGFLKADSETTATVVDHRLKRRQDMVIGHPELKAVMRDRVVRRLLPAIERHFQFQATRMDRYLVSCYDSALGGHFHRHRDNLLPGARHRRFAVSINLNDGYQGCDLVFPEFGTRRYRPPAGGAIVFATATLHQVLPITAGRRFAFVPFLYAEADVALRLQDNQHLAAGSYQYVAGDDDRLYPEPIAKAS